MTTWVLPRRLLVATALAMAAVVAHPGAAPAAGTSLSVRLPDGTTQTVVVRSGAPVHELSVRLPDGSLRTVSVAIPSDAAAVVDIPGTPVSVDGAPVPSPAVPGPASTPEPSPTPAEPGAADATSPTDAASPPDAASPTDAAAAEPRATPAPNPASGTRARPTGRGGSATPRAERRGASAPARGLGRTQGRQHAAGDARRPASRRAARTRPVRTAATRPAAPAAPAPAAPQIRPAGGGFGGPAFLLPIYGAAAARYGVPWSVLAAINEIETDYGRNLSVSSAGAVGWMQFMPATWALYGVDADGDGAAEPRDPRDAIFAAAAYLRAAGARNDLYRAIFAYNHADWYVRWVLARAAALRDVRPPAAAQGLVPVRISGAGASTGAPLAPTGASRVAGAPLPSTGPALRPAASPASPQELLARRPAGWLGRVLLRWLTALLATGAR